MVLLSAASRAITIHNQGVCWAGSKSGGRAAIAVCIRASSETLSANQFEKFCHAIITAITNQVSAHAPMIDTIIIVAALSERPNCSRSCRVPGLGWKDEQLSPVQTVCTRLTCRGRKKQVSAINTGAERSQRQPTRKSCLAGGSAF